MLIYKQKKMQEQINKKINYVDRVGHNPKSSLKILF